MKVSWCMFSWQRHSNFHCLKFGVIRNRSCIEHSISTTLKWTVLWILERSSICLFVLRNSSYFKKIMLSLSYWNQIQILSSKYTENFGLFSIYILIYAQKQIPCRESRYSIDHFGRWWFQLNDLFLHTCTQSACTANITKHFVMLKLTLLKLPGFLTTGTLLGNMSQHACSSPLCEECDDRSAGKLVAGIYLEEKWMSETDRPSPPCGIADAGKLPCVLRPQHRPHSPHHLSRAIAPPPASSPTNPALIQANITFLKSGKTMKGNLELLLILFAV